MNRRWRYGSGWWHCDHCSTRSSFQGLLTHLRTGRRNRCSHWRMTYHRRGSRTNTRGYQSRHSTSPYRTQQRWNMLRWLGQGETGHSLVTRWWVVHANCSSTVILPTWYGGNNPQTTQWRSTRFGSDVGTNAWLACNSISSDSGRWGGKCLSGAKWIKYNVPPVMWIRESLWNVTTKSVQ